MINEYISDVQAKQMQPLVLAMIGDSVQTLFVRTEVAKKYGVKVNKMNKLVSSVVQAGAQFKTFKKIEENLTEAVISASRENMEASIIALLSQKYDIATEKLAVSVALDAKDPENIEIVSIDVRAEGISSAKREEMRRYLAEQFLGNLSITVSD